MKKEDEIRAINNGNNTVLKMIRELRKEYQSREKTLLKMRVGICEYRINNEKDRYRCRSCILKNPDSSNNNFKQKEIL